MVDQRCTMVHHVSNHVSTLHELGGHVTATGALVDHWGEATYNATFCAGRVAAGGPTLPAAGPPKPRADDQRRPQMTTTGATE
jgi:hypothetical protein